MSIRDKFHMKRQTRRVRRLARHLTEVGFGLNGHCLKENAFDFDERPKSHKSA